ncbi:MAG: hypothetical protein HYX26_05695 [Acidobacteriales bacterium]|nr:hypothetical protein [Terriglobales bacterium]
MLIEAMNMDEYCVEKAVEIANALVRVEFAGVRAFYQDLSKLLPAPQVLDRLEVEEVVFWAHIMDRAAFSVLGPERRVIFQTHFYGELREVLSRNLELTDAERYRQYLDSVYDERQAEYGRFRFGQEGLPAEDVCWHYARSVCGLLGETNLVRITKVRVRCGLIAVSIFRLMRENFQQKAVR